MDLAAIGVDLAGYIPAPSNFGRIVTSDIFKRWIHREKSIAVPEGASKESQQTISQYNTLIENLKNDKLIDVKTDFQRAKFDGMGYNAQTDEAGSFSCIDF